MKRPYDVKKSVEFQEMESDNHPAVTDVWSILHSGDHISLYAPRGGSFVTIPRDQFNTIVDWYMRKQPTRRARKAA